MPNYLLFYAGTKQQVAECRYFLLKYLAIYNLKPPAGTAAVIYTNDPVAFENFANFFSQFEMPDTVNLFTKTAVLHHFLQQQKGAVLFCDTATYPVQPLEHLFADIEKGALYLHSPQQHTEADLHKALRRAAQPRDKTAIAATAPPQAHITIWHAAVVGLTDRDKELVAKLVQEETAAANTLVLDYKFTKAFSESGSIKSAAKAIFEYSRLPEFGQLLEAFFKKNDEENIPNQVKLLHHIDAAAIQQQKEAYRQQPLLKKWLQVITGKRWTIRQYGSRW